MAGRISKFLVLLGLWTSVADAQWQAVPSPADRVFAFVQSGARIFAGSENSGLWMSANGGASFAVYQTGLNEMNFDIRGFEVRQDTLWVALVGGGICRSTNAGTTWHAFNEGFETRRSLSESSNLATRFMRQSTIGMACNRAEFTRPPSSRRIGSAPAPVSRRS